MRVDHLGKTLEEPLHDRGGRHAEAACRGLHHERAYLADFVHILPRGPALGQLIEARQRGVDVRIMVAGRHNDTWLARQNSRRLYGPLLEAGIQILEYNTTFMHQKTMVVDGIWVSIGTTNFDNRSFVHNEETSVCIKNAELAAYMEQTFRRDMQSCERVTLDAWRKRGVVTKSLEAVASLLEAQV